MRYRYRSDDELKNSGVEWIGKIPKDWEVIRGKFLFENKKIKNSGAMNNVLSLTLNGVIDRDINNFEGLQPESFDGYQEFKKDNLVFKLIDLENISTSRVGLVHRDGLMSPAYIRLEKKKDINVKYYYYNYFDYYKKNIFNFLGSVGVRSALNSSDLLEMEVLNLDKQEKNKIANFLDEKTSQFDLIISKKEKLIERLEEAKKSLISEVVTGKVKVVKTDDGYEFVKRSSEEMRDSGVEWLGEIPKDWDYLPLKYLAKMSGGHAFSSDAFKNNGVQIIKIANLYNNKLSLERQPNFVDTSYLESHKDFVISKGDILISLTGTLGKRDYGYSIMLEDDRKFLLNQRVGKIKYNSNVNINYGIYILQSEAYLTSLYSLPTGTKQANLSNEQVLSIKVVLPDMEEQNKLVEYLDLKIDLINKNECNILKQIEKLKEAKQSLISEAVTGKIEILD